MCHFFFLLLVPVPVGSDHLAADLDRLQERPEQRRRMMDGHISLPNGQGMDTKDEDGQIERQGTATNELTGSGHRDFFAGTPWHKHIPANVTPT